MGGVSIKVRDVSKKYMIRASAAGTSGLSKLSSFFALSANKKNETFWALKDITFDVKEGESVGIIGMNGAGKSTLLKILSDIIRPTSGNIEIYGKMAAILEIGVGFHPELSGRENIFLYGKILGFKNEEIKEKFDEIIDFGELGSFIDNPIKFYSSGMLMRLGFSVVALLQTDILLFDEVMAVGDIGFRTKCQKKISDLKNQQRTILIVGHDINEISNYCDQLILLHKGRLLAMGAGPDVISMYQNIVLEEKSEKQMDYIEFIRQDHTLIYNQHNQNLKTHVVFEPENFFKKKPAFIPLEACIFSENTNNNKSEYISVSKSISLHFKAKFLSSDGDMAFVVRDFMNNRIFGGFVHAGNSLTFTPDSIYDLQWNIPPNIFNEGIYKIGLILFDKNYNQLLNFTDILVFRTVDEKKKDLPYNIFTPVNPIVNFECSLSDMSEKKDVDM